MLLTMHATRSSLSSTIAAVRDGWAIGASQAAAGKVVVDRAVVSAGDGRLWVQTFRIVP